MQALFKQDGWLTRDGNGLIYFHDAKPYRVVTTRENLGTGETQTEYAWYTSGRMHCIGCDRDGMQFPDVKENQALRVSMELWKQ